MRRETTRSATLTLHRCGRWRDTRRLRPIVKQVNESTALGQVWAKSPARTVESILDL